MPLKTSNDRQIYNFTKLKKYFLVEVDVTFLPNFQMTGEFALLHNSKRVSNC
jgi:hypothetical protein